MKIKAYVLIYILIIISLVFPGFVFAAQPSGDFVVVIDAGHGGKDIGATDNGVKEKDINLGVAKELASMLRKKLKNVKVVMTRDDDTFISLQERADIANRNHGNLFISIHTNSVDKSNKNRKTVSGTSVYALGLHKDQNNLKVAQRENSVIELESDYHRKYSGFDPSKDESYIIFEMAQKKNLGQSLKFADLAQKELVRTAGRVNRGVKQAGFWVLWATSMPAVLVELDFICNPTTASFMGSEKGQKKLAESLFNAVENYMGGSKNNVSGNIDDRDKKSEDSSKKSERENTKPDKNKKKKNSKKGASASINTKVDTITKERVEPVSLTPELVAATKASRTDTPPASDQGRKSGVARKRRSTASRQASGKRNLETESIPLHSESEWLAKEQIIETSSESLMMETASADTSKEEKSATSKNKSKKNKDKKKNTRAHGNTKIVINEATGEITKESIGDRKTARHQSTTGHNSKVEKIAAVYKIQVLASADELRQNNPRFCGLKPIKSFKEDNLYKYTYGESKDKKKIEALLKEVKKLIPDAFIIRSYK